MYDEETLEWLKRRSIVNMLRYYKSNLRKMSGARLDEFIGLGLIVRNRHTGRLELTKKGLRLLEESDEFPRS